MIWVRMGDSDSYHQFDSVEEGAYYVGARLSDWDNSVIAWPLLYGVMLAPCFQGRNYISCYWGNRNANPTRHLNEAEKAIFEDELRRAYYKETE